MLTVAFTHKNCIASANIFFYLLSARVTFCGILFNSLELKTLYDMCIITGIGIHDNMSMIRFLGQLQKLKMVWWCLALSNLLFITQFQGRTYMYANTHVRQLDATSRGILATVKHVLSGYSNINKTNLMTQTVA